MGLYKNLDNISRCGLFIAQNYWAYKEVVNNPVLAYLANLFRGHSKSVNYIRFGLLHKKRMLR
jgi:hypothetical protein